MKRKTVITVNHFCTAQFLGAGQGARQQQDTIHLKTIQSTNTPPSQEQYNLQIHHPFQYNTISNTPTI